MGKFPSLHAIYSRNLTYCTNEIKVPRNVGLLKLKSKIIFTNKTSRFILTEKFGKQCFDVNMLICYVKQSLYRPGVVQSVPGI